MPNYSDIMLVEAPISCIVDGATGSDVSVGVFGGVAGILGRLMCVMGINSFLVIG
jgi:hypothetical protein